MKLLEHTPLDEHALLVVRLLDELGVLDPHARGRAMAARPLAAAVLDSFDLLRRLEQAAAARMAPPEEGVPVTRAERYASLVNRVREQLLAHVPEGGHVAVISRGDPKLTDLPGRIGSHFPQDHDGGWAGHYPANGADAVAHLETVRRRGIQWLAIPSPASWWLQYYAEVRDHLLATGRQVIANDDLGLWFMDPPGPQDGQPQSRLSGLAQLLRALVPAGADVLTITSTEDAPPPDGLATLPIRLTLATASNGRAAIDAHSRLSSGFVVLVDPDQEAPTATSDLVQHLTKHHALLATRSGLGSIFELVTGPRHYTPGGHRT